MLPDRLSFVVDENVPYARESFGGLGTVTVLPGRRIAPPDVTRADVLIVRSVTRVDEALLAGSSIRFVGTATIGCDHVDVEYLKSRGIAFASAPGSNANSVAEYVTAALLQSAHARGTTLDGATIAVVGVGNVGSRVVSKAEALGMRCVLNDPPRARETGDPAFVPLAEALRQAQYVTLHVPLERGGPDATVGMVDNGFFERLRPGAVFLNTSRGGVVREEALAAALDRGQVPHAILDVFQHEPDIDPEIVRRAFIATPHIAGYSFDGKVAATSMLYDAVCAWLTRPAGVDLSPMLPPSSVPRVDLRAGNGPDEARLRAAVEAVYDVMEDDRALREAVAAPERGARFDLLRKTYRKRREFRHTTVVVRRDQLPLIDAARRLGFRTETQ